MSDKHPILNKVIAGLIAAGILSMVSWITGWVSTICGTFRNLSIELGRALASSVSIPLWLFIILVSVFLINILAITIFTFRRRRSSTPPLPVPPPPLNHLDEAILKMLVALDDTMVLMHSDILKKTGEPRLKISQTLDRLIELDYIMHRSGRLSHSGYYLTSSGRDYVIEKGYF